MWAWWSMMPMTRNRPALNRAWANSTVTPATVASGSPAPNRVTMNPSWLTVP